MKEESIVSELALLGRIIRPENQQDVLLPNGDDAAVLRIGRELIAITTDTVIEGRHFDFSYYTPPQVGAKAIEAAVSDLIAVGAEPRGIVIGLSLPPLASPALIESIYQGVYAACERLHCSLLGGDITTGGSGIELAVTAIGRIADERRIRRRSDARAGDLIFVSGELGGSMAGLRAIQSGLPGCEEARRRHLEPRCRLDLLDKLAPLAHALIDVSDGLASEIRHICRASRCGALLYAERVPLAGSTRAVAAALHEDPLSYALNGGEDYELLYTVAPEQRAEASGTEIGVIIDGEDQILLERAGERRPLTARGYDHFSAE